VEEIGEKEKVNDNSQTRKPPLAAMAKPHPHSVHLASTDLTLEWSHVETTVEGSVVEDQCS